MAHRLGSGVMITATVIALHACGGNAARDTERVESASSPTESSPAASATPAPSTSMAAAGWTAAPSLLQPRSAHGVVELDGALYAVAGTGEDGKPVLEVDRFDGAVWTVVTTMPGYGVNAPSVAAVGGRIYVIGGFTGVSGTPTDAVQTYDPSTSTWSKAAPLPGASGGHGAAVLDDAIHVIGGGNARSTIADHVVYDPTTDTWTAAAPLPRAEGSPAVVALDGRIWAIGGRSGSNDYGESYVYDPTTDTWTTGPSVVARGTAGAVVECGTIFLAGGEMQATEQVVGDVLRLDGDTWVADEPLPTPRSFARMVVLDGAIYVVGGSIQYGQSHASPGIGAVERFTADC